MARWYGPVVGSRNVAFARISASLVALDPERGMMLLLGAWNRIWILALGRASKMLSFVDCHGQTFRHH